MTTATKSHGTTANKTDILNFCRPVLSSFPCVAPQQAYLKDIKHAKYFPITDEEAVNAFQLLSKL